MAFKKLSTSSIIDTSIKSVEWSDDSDRLILYADIMGFSHRVKHDNHSSLKSKLIKFKKSWESKIKPLRKGDYLRSVQFSDSILLVVNGTDAKMFNLITKAAVCLVQSALSSGFPIKGVLASGKFTYDKENELYFGLPLVDAYLLHDEIQYYGIVVHHSAEQIVKLYTDSSKPYTKAKVNLKKGMTSHYHLSWHMLDSNLSKGNIANLGNDWLDKIEESVSGAPRIYVDNTRAVISLDNDHWNTAEEYVN